MVYQSLYQGGYQVHGFPSQPPSKPVWQRIVGRLVGAVLVFAVGYGALLWWVHWRMDTEAQRGIGLVYEVSGTVADVHISYHAGDLEQETANSTGLPWRAEVIVTGFAKYGSVSASRTGQDSGTLQCRILRDGVVIDEDRTTESLAGVFCTTNTR